MSHEHEWVPYNVVVTWTYAYDKIEICKHCRTFRLWKDGESAEKT